MAPRELLAMSTDEVAALLDEGQRVQVATINPDGTPHVVPLAYVVLEGRLTLWTDPRSKKVVNLRRDPRLTCLVEEGRHFGELRAVQLSGRAELTAAHDVSLRVGLALFERSGAPMDDERTKVMVAALAPDRVAVTVHPERIVSWDHRKLASVAPGDIGSSS